MEQLCEKNRINYQLVIDKKIDKETLLNIIEQHNKKDEIIETMKITSAPEQLKILAKKITKIEFKLQDLWKFEQNDAFHRFWELPNCTCPKFDNEDSYGTKYSIYSFDCPIHGQGMIK